MKLKKLRFKRKLIFFTRTFIILLFIITLFLQVKHIIVSSTVNFVTQSEFTKLEEPVSILFMGADYGGQRDIDTENPPRGDTLITMTISPSNVNENVEVNLTSIPRDTRMPITCNENYEDKVNSAFSYGYLLNADLDEAITCQMETVEQFFGVDLDYYVLANFDTFIDLIDSIGGVDINVPYSFYEMDSNDTQDALYFEEGLQTLDGEHALAYARQRHALNPYTGYSGDDFERNIRQQEVLMAAVSKILANPVNYIDDVINIVYNSMETNLNVAVMTNFANFGVSYLNNYSSALATHHNFNLYLKDSFFSKLIYINPYEDLLGIDTNDLHTTVFSEQYDSLLNQNTMATIIPIDYRDYNYPSTEFTDDSNVVKPQSIEFMMNTIDTFPANDGSGDELTTYASRNYYSELIGQALNQEANIENFMTYATE